MKLLAVIALAGCISPKATECGDGLVCPDGTVCASIEVWSPADPVFEARCVAATTANTTSCTSSSRFMNSAALVPTGCVML